MSRFRSLAWLAAVALSWPVSSASAQDVDAGAKVFKKCKVCHAVGDGATNRVGPFLNDVFGRTAGTVEGYRYSRAMIAAGVDGLVWNDETIGALVTKPRDFLKGTKMTFAGLTKEEDRVDLIAYLKTFSSAGDAEAEDDKADATPPASDEEGEVVLAKDAVIPEHGVFHLGRRAGNEEIAAWDIDIRPDGVGLPKGRGTVTEGEALFTERCAICHGDFGEGRDRWPVLAGGQGSLTDERPEKTIGSYWPYLSTVYDYVRRAMPFGDARSLTDDDVYALTAYLLYLNDVVTDEDFELSDANFGDIRLPNEMAFIADDRASESHYAEKAEPCMSDCIPGEARITKRARVLDVTPEEEDAGIGAIE
ncbi:MAG: c-type cytochrome [Rhizobiaceae bacterium]